MILENPRSLYGKVCRLTLPIVKLRNLHKRWSNMEASWQICSNLCNIALAMQ